MSVQPKPKLRSRPLLPSVFVTPSHPTSGAFHFGGASNTTMVQIYTETRVNAFVPPAILQWFQSVYALDLFLHIAPASCVQELKHTRFSIMRQDSSSESDGTTPKDRPTDLSADLSAAPPKQFPTAGKTTSQTRIYANPHSSPHNHRLELEFPFSEERFMQAVALLLANVHHENCEWRRKIWDKLAQLPDLFPPPPLDPHASAAQQRPPLMSPRRPSMAVSSIPAMTQQQQQQQQQQQSVSVPTSFAGPAAGVDLKGGAASKIRAISNARRASIRPEAFVPPSLNVPEKVIQETPKELYQKLESQLLYPRQTHAFGAINQYLSCLFSNLQSIAMSVVVALEGILDDLHHPNLETVLISIAHSLVSAEKVSQPNHINISLWNMYFALNWALETNARSSSKYVRAMVAKSVEILAPLYARHELSLMPQILTHLINVADKSEYERYHVKLAISSIITEVVQAGTSNKIQNWNLFSTFINLLTSVAEDNLDMYSWALSIFSSKLSLKVQDSPDMKRFAGEAIAQFVAEISQYIQSSTALHRYASALSILSLCNGTSSILELFPQQKLLESILRGCLDDDMQTRYVCIEVLSFYGTQWSVPKDLASDFKLALGGFRLLQQKPIPQYARPLSKPENYYSYLSQMTEKSKGIGCKSFTQDIAKLPYMSLEHQASLLEKLQVFSQSVDWEGVDSFSVQSLVTMLLDIPLVYRKSILKIVIKIFSTTEIQLLAPHVEMVYSYIYTLFMQLIYEYRPTTTSMFDPQDCIDIIVFALDLLALLPINQVSVHSISGFLYSIAHFPLHPDHEVRKKAYLYLEKLAMSSDQYAVVDKCLCILILSLGDSRPECFELLFSILKRIIRTLPRYRRLDSVLDQYEVPIARKTIENLLIMDMIIDALLDVENSFLTNTMKDPRLLSIFWAAFHEAYKDGLVEYAESRAKNEYCIFGQNFFLSSQYPHLFVMLIKKLNVISMITTEDKATAAFELTIPFVQQMGLTLRSFTAQTIVRSVLEKRKFNEESVHHVMIFLRRLLASAAFEQSTAIEIGAQLASFGINPLTRSLLDLMAAKCMEVIELDHPSLHLKYSCFRFFASLLLTQSMLIVPYLDKLRESMRRLIARGDGGISRAAVHFYPLLFRFGSLLKPKEYFEYLTADIDLLQKPKWEREHDPLLSKLYHHQGLRLLIASVKASSAMADTSYALLRMQDCMRLLHHRNRNLRYVALQCILFQGALLDDKERCKALWVALPLLGSSDPRIIALLKKFTLSKTSYIDDAIQVQAKLDEESASLHDALEHATTPFWLLKRENISRFYPSTSSQGQDDYTVYYDDWTQDEFCLPMSPALISQALKSEFQSFKIPIPAQVLDEVVFHLMEFLQDDGLQCVTLLVLSEILLFSSTGDSACMVIVDHMLMMLKKYTDHKADDIMSIISTTAKVLSLAAESRSFCCSRILPNLLLDDINYGQARTLKEILPMVLRWEPDQVKSFSKTFLSYMERYQNVSHILDEVLGAIAIILPDVPVDDMISLMDRVLMLYTQCESESSQKCCENLIDMSILRISLPGFEKNPLWSSLQAMSNLPLQNVPEHTRVKQAFLLKIFARHQTESEVVGRLMLMLTDPSDKVKEAATRVLYNDQIGLADLSEKLKHFNPKKAIRRATQALVSAQVFSAEKEKFFVNHPKKPFSVPLVDDDPFNINFMCSPRYMKMSRNYGLEFDVGQYAGRMVPKAMRIRSDEGLHEPAKKDAEVIITKNDINNALQLLLDECPESVTIILDNLSRDMDAADGDDGSEANKGNSSLLDHSIMQVSALISNAIGEGGEGIRNLSEGVQRMTAFYSKCQQSSSKSRIELQSALDRAITFYIDPLELPVCNKKQYDQIIDSRSQVDVNLTLDGMESKQKEQERIGAQLDSQYTNLMNRVDRQRKVIAAIRDFYLNNSASDMNQGLGFFNEALNDEHRDIRFLSAQCIVDVISARMDSIGNTQSWEATRLKSDIESFLDVILKRANKTGNALGRKKLEYFYIIYGSIDYLPSGPDRLEFLNMMMDGLEDWDSSVRLFCIEKLSEMCDTRRRDISYLLLPKESTNSKVIARITRLLQRIDYAEKDALNNLLSRMVMVQSSQLKTPSNSKTTTFQ